MSVLIAQMVQKYDPVIAYRKLLPRLFPASLLVKRKSRVMSSYSKADESTGAFRKAEGGPYDARSQGASLPRDQAQGTAGSAVTPWEVSEIESSQRVFRETTGAVPGSGPAEDPPQQKRRPARVSVPPVFRKTQQHKSQKDIWGWMIYTLIILSGL